MSEQGKMKTLFILALFCLSSKPYREDTISVEIGYTYALLEASGEAARQCHIFGDDSKECSASEDIIGVLNDSWIEIVRDNRNRQRGPQ